MSLLSKKTVKKNAHSKGSAFWRNWEIRNDSYY